jgi:hypothetical protein
MVVQYPMENPMEIGELARLADSYIAAREARLTLQKEVDKLQEQESEHKATLMAALSSAGAMGVAGHKGRVTLVTKTEPTVRNWEEFYAYIVRNDAFDLLQKRLSAPAVRERWEAGETVEGVGTIPVTNLSITKL